MQGFGTNILINSVIMCHTYVLRTWNSCVRTLKRANNSYNQNTWPSELYKSRLDTRFTKINCLNYVVYFVSTLFVLIVENKWAVTSCV